jgi:hypothetical protein
VFSVEFDLSIYRNKSRGAEGFVNVGQCHASGATTADRLAEKLVSSSPSSSPTVSTTRYLAESLLSGRQSGNNP